MSDGKILTAAVSVVIPCYRCGTTIRRAMESVFAQTVRPAEVILVDDCSGDGTLAVLEQIAEEYPSGWIKIIPLSRNAGAGGARNAGWDVASQPYIAFLDADDSWHPRKTEIQYRWMKANPEAAMSGHPWAILSKNDSFSAIKEDLLNTSFHPVSKRQLLFSNRFSTPCVMIRWDLPVRFTEGKRYSEDYLLWLEIVCRGFKAYRCDSPLTFLHKAVYGESGLSAQLWQMEKGQLDTYQRIRFQRHIGAVTFGLLYIWSWVRFFRRLAKTCFLRRRRGGAQNSAPYKGFNF